MSLKILGQEQQSALTEETQGVTRRNFLKILGAASAVGVAGCSDSNKQSIFPNVNGVQEGIPGVAVWFSSTCTECSAGCGIQVRTREGRVVKVEGNPDSPINKGGLCALGQSSVQNLYDPDRIREPLKRDASGKLVPISWDEALAKVSEVLKSPNAKKAFLTGEKNGTTDELLESWCKSFNVQRVSYDLTQQTALAKASELVYGTYGVPTYSLGKAEVILNFGADFLETFVSPVEYARGWADGRRRELPARYVHVEPRLSLSGANADLWLKNKPGSEIKIALAVLKVLVDAGKGQGLKDEVRQALGELTKSVDVSQNCAEAEVSLEKVLSTAYFLKEAKASLVLAGGAAASSLDPLPLHVVVNFINLVLSNVGETINLASMRKPRSSASAVFGLVDSIRRGEVNAVFIHDTNPLFSFPTNAGLDVALHKISSLGLDEAVKFGTIVVSFSSQLDETTSKANLILPSHTSLESWGDVRAVPGVNGLIQPAMQPVFNTRSFGDILITSAQLAGNTTLATETSVLNGKPDFLGYLKASWKRIHASSKVGGDFNKFWLESLERGGYFDASATSERVRVKVAPEAFVLKFNEAPTRISAFGEVDINKEDLLLYPFPSVRSFDGRAANRPWMHEIPDPISQIAWDSWAEIHPETAKQRGIATGDFVTIRNFYGEVDVPAYITDHVHPGIIAVPIGNGHSAYGRYASSVKGGNVLKLLADKYAKSSDSIALLSAGVRVSRGPGAAELVNVQGSDDQMGRGLTRTSFIGENVGAAHGAPVLLATGHGHSEKGKAHGEEEHAPKQMYEQRKHPLYEWGMAVDLSACTGCSACVVACYAENNLPVVGKKVMYQGREMSWLRIERYYEGGEGKSEELQVSFLPMMCQHCHNAPCEPVCPVYATYHNEEGLNAMVYNRCVGTRYCSNNCSYKVRRFNWFEFDLPEPLTWQLNPDLVKRGVGVMEKCTFCVQRITEAKDQAKDAGRMVRDGEVQPACVQSCPTQALTFGNLKDPTSRVSQISKDERAYKVLDHHINTQPAVSYLERLKYKA